MGTASIRTTNNKIYRKQNISAHTTCEGSRASQGGQGLLHEPPMQSTLPGVIPRTPLTLCDRPDRIPK